MPKTIVLAAGGTAGHLFPAQKVATDLTERLSCTTLFAAKGLSTNPRFDKNRFTGVDVEAGPASLKGIFANIRGIKQSVALLKKTRPDLVIGFGSYHSFPVLVAALLCRVPVILHEANRQPGRVNRLLSRFAAFTAVFFPDTPLSGMRVVADIPLRCPVETAPSRDEALQHYGLCNLPTVLVFGGSLGAEKVNDLACKSVCLLAEKMPLQVLHFTGNAASAEDIQKRYRQAGVTGVVRDFEHEMSCAWMAADLVVCRSGASTVAEQLAFSVPALFIPYPQAADLHQDANAAYVQDVVGAAKLLKQSLLCEHALRNHIEEALSSGWQQTARQHLLHHKKTSFHTSFTEEILKFLGSDI